ncbi:MAG: hypothetical protein ACJ70X_04390 [Nitrososphaera sp.]
MNESCSLYDLVLYFNKDKLKILDKQETKGEAFAENEIRMNRVI